MWYYKKYQYRLEGANFMEDKNVKILGRLSFENIKTYSVKDRKTLSELTICSIYG